MSISILILTKNEEQDLPDCLASVAWSDDVHVLDSMSTDNTVQLAKNMGAIVTLRKFDGYASQRNAGLQLPFKHRWVLILDADERVPSALVDEMRQFISNAPEHIAAARMRRRDIWQNTWLKHAQISPYFVRLARVGRCHYEREINEIMMVDGDIANLQQAFDHYPFSKGLSHWLEKHNQYSSKEAETIAHNLNITPSWKTALFSRDFNERRVHQKAIFYRLPARPLIKFLYMLFYRRAFLDGWPGVQYAILQSMYEYQIVLKVQELNFTNKK